MTTLTLYHDDESELIINKILDLINKYQSKKAILEENIYKQ